MELAIAKAAGSAACIMNEAAMAEVAMIRSDMVVMETEIMSVIEIAAIE
jgi:hypothetical protein